MPLLINSSLAKTLYCEFNENVYESKYAVLTNEKLVVRTGAFLKSLLNQSFS